MRHPVIISSLEEDFKNLGLADDKPALSEAELEAEEQEEDELEEARRRRVSGKSKSVRTKRMTGKEKAKSRSYEMKHKAKRKQARKRRKKSAAWKKLQKFNKRFMKDDVNTPTLRGGTLSGLFEEVETILTSLDEDRVENAVKSFANVAIISEMLGDFFEAVLDEGIEDEELAEELSEASVFFADMSESAAAVATALNEGEELDVTLDEIEEAFNEQMESLVEGLELYADLTEDEDDLEEDEDFEDDDLEEDEDDDLEESIKFRMRSKLGKR